MYRFCAENGIPHDRCGKLVVATSEAELPALDELERRGAANGLRGLQRLQPARTARDRTARRGGRGALRAGDRHRELQGGRGGVRPQDRGSRRAGSHRRRSSSAASAKPDGLVVETTAGPLRAKLLVNCAGLQSDRVARLCGVEPGVQIVPFRGEYYELKPHAEHLCKHLIYPVPDPASRSSASTSRG